MIAIGEETRRLDAHSPPPSSDYECTMLEDCTIPLEDNTELISCCGETQVIDYSDEDERTVVLGEDSDEVGISDADGASSLVFDVHDNQRGECEGEDATLKGCDGSVDVDRCSGSAKRSIAEFRVASFRAIMLSHGHKMSHKYTDPEISSLIRLEDSYGEKLVKGIQSSVETKKDDEMHLNCGDNKFGIGEVSRKVTARKLFDGQTSDEEKNASANETIANVGEELHGTLGFDNSIAGLSYVNSQQPSEFSQANALKAVETFLSLDDIGLSQNGGLEMPGGLKVPLVSSFNGIKWLAKASSKSPVGGSDAFDWIDAVEDESGGGFLTKINDSIFVDQANAKKMRRCPHKSSHIFPGKNEDPLDSGTWKKDTVHRSLSRTKGLSLSDSRTEIPILVESIKSQIDVEPAIIQHMDAEQVDTGMDCTYNVGPDTQMAVEAMEALAYVLSSEEISKKTTPCVGDSNGSNWSRITKKRSLRHANQQKIVCPISDFDGSLRRSKRSKASTTRLSNGSNLIPSTRKSSSKVSDCSKEGTVTVMQKAKDAEDKRKKIVKSSTTIKKRIGQKKGEKGICGIGNDSTCFKGVKNSLDKDCLHIKGKSTQVVHRTRQSRETGSLQNLDALFDNNSGKIKYFENGRTTQAKGCTFELNAVQSKRQGTILNHFDMQIDEGLKQDTCKTYSGLEVTTTWHPKRRRTNLTLNCTEKSRDIINPTKSTVKSTHMTQENTELGSSRKEDIQPSETPYSSPINKINAPSPVCTSVNPLQIPKSKKLSRSSVARELSRLEFKVAISASALKDTRKRKDISMVCPLFSRHLGDDIIKQQKKILARFKITIVSSISDATHFITNKFIRTKNMLEAMALGKPVVTHLWLESCGQTGCYIDEKKYILRDSRAEKDAGFIMPVSLARASQSPLLQDKQVFITPNVKPDLNTISSLVKASGGQPLERIIRSIRLDKTVPDDFLVISCEEDYTLLIPLLEKGTEIFSSELLLNGIVIQKLQYERHRLFSNHI